MIKLSIIILYHNTGSYTEELLNRLNPQITDEVEVLVIDDGSEIPFSTSYSWVKIHRQDCHGVSFSRNQGIERTKGEYFTFIDSDDLVAENYVQSVLGEMPFDYLEMSWKSFQGFSCHCKLNTKSDYLNNCSVWSRVFNRKFVGNVRFNENKDATEDEEFTRKLGCRGKTDKNRAILTDYMYFYRTDTDSSLFNKYMRGECNTKRVVYYYPKISKEMSFLVDEIREEDKKNEVWVLTDENQVPELEFYAQVSKPFHIRGMELRGMPTNLFEKIDIPIKTQVVIWTNKTFAIGGLETFTYNFCMAMKDYYDIVVLYNQMDDSHIERLNPYVRCIKNNVQIPVDCDTLIVNRIIDVIPSNIRPKRTIQMVHTCKHIATYHIPQERDMSICVSEACRKSYGTEGDKSLVIHNVISNEPVKKALLLVSATRLDTNEKGQKRMLKLASLLDVHKIPYVWLYFSNHKLENASPNLVCMNPTLNIKDYIAMASYLVQLSDTEAFCYSIVEALQLGVPVICTELEVLSEIGFKEGVNGYTVPFNYEEDYDVEKFYKHQLKGFKYNYDNDGVIRQWRKVLGNTTPLHDYKPYVMPKKKVRVIVKYYDVVKKVQLYPNMELEMNYDRAIYLQDVKQFVEIIE